MKKLRTVLLIVPGKSGQTQAEHVSKYIGEHQPIVIGVDTVNPLYQFDYLFIGQSI